MAGIERSMHPTGCPAADLLRESIGTTLMASARRKLATVNGR